MHKLIFFRLALLIPLLSGINFALFSQTTISQWTYEPPQGSTATPTPNTGSGSSTLIGSMNTATTGTGINTGTGCGAQVTGTTAWAMTSTSGSSNESSGVQYNVSTVGFEDIIVRWEQRWSNAAPNTIRFQYTLNGTTWTNLTMTTANTTFCNGSLNDGRFQTNTTGDVYRRIEVNLSDISGADNNANFGFRIVAAHYQTTGQFRTVTNVATVSTGGTWRFDNVRISGTALPPPVDPTVTINSNLSSFNYVLNEGPSANQSFTVSGINLTNNIVVSVPSGYEQALVADGPYQTSNISLTPTGGTVSSTSIFVRLIAGQSANTYGGNISIVSDALSSPNTIAIQGQVIAETLPYAETFGLIAGTLPLGWTRSGLGGNNWNIDLSSTSAPLGGGSANLADNGTVTNQEAIITCNRAISTMGHDLVRVKFNARKTSSYSGSVFFDYSTDGINWTNVPFTDVPNDGFWSTVFFFLPLDAANVPNLRVRFRTTRTNTSGNYRIDDFTLLPPGIEVNLSTSVNTGNENDETEITITATTVSPVINNETIILALNGTTISNQDYDLSATSILIPAGESSGSVVFKVLNDNLNEGTENVTITFGTISFDLQPGTNASITILDAAHDAIYLTTINSPSTTVTFDELQNNGSTLFDITAGFYIFEEGVNGNGLYRADNGSGSTGDTYSFGSNLTNERALGSINTSPNFLTNNFGAKIVNNTNKTMEGLVVAYTGEQWRRGTATTDQLLFSYSTDATALNNGTWTEVPALHFVAPQTVGGSATLDGNLAANQTQFNVAINGLNLPVGQTMWIRWRDLDVTNSDHGLAVDNVILTPFINTQLIASNCGATGVSMSQNLRASDVNAAAYRFRIQGQNNGGAGWDNNAFIYDAAPGSRSFRFQFIPGAIFGATYAVSVAVGDGNGNFAPFGTACNVSLASVPTSVLETAFCGATISHTTDVFATAIQGAQAYRFRINGGQEVISTDRKVKMSEFSTVVWGQTYAVDIAVQSADGSWGAYGTPCNITVSPVTQLEVAQCNINNVQMAAEVKAIGVSGATGFRFRITGPNNGGPGWVNDVFILTRPNRVFTFNMVPGSLQGEQYMVQVAATNNSADYAAYGPICNITLFGTPQIVINDNEMMVNNKTIEAINFTATASQNPFNTDFGIQILNANDTESIHVAIFDMSGKLIEINNVNPADIENARFGQNLASGMYMIEVKQGSNQALIRQVKN